MYLVWIGVAVAIVVKGGGRFCFIIGGIIIRSIIIIACFFNTVVEASG